MQPQELTKARIIWGVFLASIVGCFAYLIMQFGMSFGASDATTFMADGSGGPMQNAQREMIFTGAAVLLLLIAFFIPAKNFGKMMARLVIMEAAVLCSFYNSTLQENNMPYALAFLGGAVILFTSFPKSAAAAP